MSLLLSLCLVLLPQDPPDDAKPAQRLQPMPVPHHLVQHRGDAHLTIDGSLQDWPDLPPMLLDDVRQITGTQLGAWRGAHDFAARAFLLWDEDYLYIGVVVRDDWHRALTKDTPRLQEIPPADCVVVTIDPGRDTRAVGLDEGRRDDREYWLADVEGQGTRVVAWDRFRGTAAFAEGAHCVIKADRQAGTTVYEAGIPWADVLLVGDKPAARRVLDMQVVANDYDEATDAMPQTRLGWTFGTGDSIDPGLLGSVMLWPKGSPLPETLPEFPPPVEPATEPVPPQSYWVDFLASLKSSPPQAVTGDSGHPSEVGGLERLHRLESLEHHLATFPRVDYLEYLQRTQRRMRREVAGVVKIGLPFFWQHCLEEVRRQASGEAPEHGFRLFRLPEGGWLVRSKEANFAIDPRGANIETQIGAALDFVLLTSPLDVTRRSDQMLLRLTAVKRPFYTHIRFHLPAVEASKMSLVEIGQTYTTSGLKVKVLGRKNDEGMVTHTIGYQVEWPDGTTLVHSAQALQEDEFPDGQRTDLLILSPRHPRANRVGQQLAAKLTVVDETFECAVVPGATGRFPLAMAFELQNGLRPQPSILLAPGESVTVERDK